MSPPTSAKFSSPFVFLDLVGFDGRSKKRFATRRRPASKVLSAGGVEWMRAGNGVWHAGAPEEGRVKAFQLSVALPPALENAANASHYVMPKDVPVEGPAGDLGEYGDAKSPIAAPPMSYLSVSLRAGERWTYHPTKGHTVAWVAVVAWAGALKQLR